MNRLEGSLGLSWKDRAKAGVIAFALISFASILAKSVTFYEEYEGVRREAAIRADTNGDFITSADEWKKVCQELNLQYAGFSGHDMSLDELNLFIEKHSNIHPNYAGNYQIASD